MSRLAVLQTFAMLVLLVGGCRSSSSPVTDTCHDGRRDALESDVDCGGGCDGCALGGACTGDADCQSGVCSASGVCVADACHAGRQDVLGLPGVAVVKALASTDRWLLLVETLQLQAMVTVPSRAMVLLDGRLATVATYPPIEGWTLVDATLHPSGEVSAVHVRADYSYLNDPPQGVAYPLRVLLSRHRRDGSRVDTEVPPIAPSDPYDITKVGMASLDRVRIVAAADDVVLVARWAGNAVHAHRFTFGAEGFAQRWATRIEPETSVSVLGIIGGGFDNFHQGDSQIFAYLDVDAEGSTYVAVPSTGSVLADHDAAFGDNLSAGADPSNLDFGAAILTRVDAEGRRVYARLLGSPGRTKSLLNLRAAGDSVILVGRVKTGADGGAWDAWILSAEAASGAARFEAAVDVSLGDMFWDAAPVPGQRVIAVGSTGYVQNPSGVSVSDERDALAVLLDPGGLVIERLDLPHGAPGRGNEALSVRLQDGCTLAIAGMLDAPGTHADVYSNGFLQLRSFEAASAP